MWDAQLARAVAQTVGMALQNKAHRATKYISPTFVVRATQRRLRGKLRKDVDLVVTAGRPNFIDRQFIKRANKAGEPFPVKKIQLKFPPRRRV